MKIAVIGTGMVGRALASRTEELGHDVAIGTRDREATPARTEPDQMANPPFATWLAEHSDIALLPLPDAAAQSELIINATSGHASVEALQAACETNLSGKVLIDIANPLDFSTRFPDRVQRRSPLPARRSRLITR